MADTVLDLQRTLNARGFGPLVEDGRYGPLTEEAHRHYLATMTEAPVVTPAPEKPWWTSRAQVGWLLAIGLNLASRWLGVELEPDAWIPPILEVLSGISALVGLYGSTKRTAPIDQTLVLPGVRLRSSAAGVRRSLPSSRGSESGSADGGGSSFPEGPFFDN